MGFLASRLAIDMANEPVILDAVNSQIKLAHDRILKTTDYTRVIKTGVLTNQPLSIYI